METTHRLIALSSVVDGVFCVEDSLKKLKCHSGTHLIAG